MSEDDAQVPVIQADREAAADYIAQTSTRFLGSWLVELRHGEHDDEEPLVQAFARHRLAYACNAVHLFVDNRSENIIEQWQAKKPMPDSYNDVRQYDVAIMD